MRISDWSSDVCSSDLLPTPCRAFNGERECRWRQLDVVYVHWSGGIEGLSPYRNTLDSQGELRKIPRCQCGTDDFRLVKQGNQFSRWRFRCTGCAAERAVYQTDPFTLSRSEERSVGKDCVSTCRSRGSPDH